MNKVILIGNVGGDPELKFIESGKAVCNFSLATSESWKNSQGEYQNKTEWHRLVVWGKTAEFCGRNVSKGDKISVEGVLRYRNWEDKDGNKRTTAEVEVSNVTPLIKFGKKEDSETASDYVAAPDSSFDNSFDDDDIPF